MLIVETIAKIRRLFRNEHKSIREISRELRLSRKVEPKLLPDRLVIGRGDVGRRGPRSHAPSGGP